MDKLPKMLGCADAPYMASLMRLIETQSKMTLCKWCIDYAEKNILPIYEKQCSGDMRLQHDIALARDWFTGKVKFTEVRRGLQAHAAVSAWGDKPVAVAAANAVVQAVFTMHSLRFAFYGAAAVAYDRVGLNETAEIYAQIAEEFYTDYEAALRAIAVEDEPNPARINWKNWLWWLKQNN